MFLVLLVVPLWVLMHTVVAAVQAKATSRTLGNCPPGFDALYGTLFAPSASVPKVLPSRLVCQVCSQ